MILTRLLEHIGGEHARGIVFSAGGSADLVLAKTIAASLTRHGCAHVDLAQPLNCKALSSKGLLAEAGEFYGLKPATWADPELVLQHHAAVPSGRHSDGRRGQGLSISSSLEWNHGDRFVFAAHGGGATLLAGRHSGDAPWYDFAVGVDGGGDVLTGGEQEFDRIVLNGFRSGWDSSRPLALVVMGLGADGASSPEEFQDVVLEGWTQVARTCVDSNLARSMQSELERLGLWHPAPSAWTERDPYWGYGLKVPQIIALAVQAEFPFVSPGSDTDIVMFPRRRELKAMDRRLLCEARLFLSQGVP